jgi:hypothetical protein
VTRLLEKGCLLTDAALLLLAGVHTLAYCIVDYKGHRLVAQSVVPGLLYGNKTAELKYGSPDLGETIKWDKDFHEKVKPPFTGLLTSSIGPLE